MTYFQRLTSMRRDCWILIAWLAVAAPTGAVDTAYLSKMAQAVRTAADRVLPAVVTVELIGAGGSVAGEVEQDAPTSGVVIDHDGFILASSIVAERPSASILVVLADGSRHAAAVVARDQHRELVLLRIRTDKSLVPIELNGNPQLPIGATTVAVGRYGNDAAPIVSRGILSARDRLDGIALQTDARVSPAFYGGPLVDLYGNVLGILVPAVGEGGAPEATSWYDSGIAFAIPSEVIANKIDRLKAGQDIQKGLIGIVAKSRDPIAAGTEVAAVRTRSPAESAGIEPGDQIISVAGRTVRRHQEIRQVLGQFDAGETITLKIRRDDRAISIELQLAETIPPLQPQRIGIIVSRSQDGDSSVVTVDGVQPESAAADKLQVGDVIAKLGETEIFDVDSLRRQMISAEPDQPLTFTVRRDDQERQIKLTPTDVAGKLNASVPDRWDGTDEAPWKTTKLQLPDVANAATFVAPDPEAPTDSSQTKLGLLVLLLGPGEETPAKVLETWPEQARKAGVVVCAVAPEDDQRWQPKELSAIANFAAAVMKKVPIDPAAVAVATSGAVSDGKASAADSMALAVAISQSKTFFGVALAARSATAGDSVARNEPSSSLQLLVPVATDDELPAWSAALRRLGYPIVLGESLDRESLLNWVRLLQAI